MGYVNGTTIVISHFWLANQNTDHKHASTSTDKMLPTHITTDYQRFYLYFVLQAHAQAHTYTSHKIKCDEYLFG